MLFKTFNKTNHLYESKFENFISLKPSIRSSIKFRDFWLKPYSCFLMISFKLLFDNNSTLFIKLFIFIFLFKIYFYNSKNLNFYYLY